jgi:dodecin
MNENVYKIIELTGTSSTSIEDAIQKAVAKAAQSIRKIGWFEVIETRGRVDGDKVVQWQVTIKLGFTVED